jgi:hypothetical protein
MAHNKVYGICENKCRVEVIPKLEEIILNGTEIKLALNGKRYITRASVLNPIPLHINDSFNGSFEIVCKRTDRGRVLPYTYFNITGGKDVKFINNVTIDSTHTILHFKFYYNGYDYVCEWLSYVG